MSLNYMSPTDMATTCDNCCENFLWEEYTPAIVYGEAVALCSIRCFTELVRVWAPARRGWSWSWRQALRGVAACLLAGAWMLFF